MAKNANIIHFYRPKMTLLESNVFTGLFLSTGAGVLGNIKCIMG